MNPLHRKQTDKHYSSKQFNHKSSKTKAANLRTGPMRGGIRL